MEKLYHTYPVGELYENIIKDIHATGLIKVTGSYADGTQTMLSDIDFYIKEDEPDPEFDDDGVELRNIDVIIKILEKYPINLKSSITGHIATHNINDNLPIALEFSDLFDAKDCKYDEVIICGYTFKTC